MVYKLSRVKKRMRDYYPSVLLVASLDYEVLCSYVEISSASMGLAN